MDKNIKIIAIVISIVIISSFIFFREHVFTFGYKDKIVGALDPTYPPFEYVEKDTNKIIGLDVDLVNAISKEMGVEIEIRAMSYGGIMPALLAGQIDFIASPITVTAERMKNVDFTQEVSNGNSSMLVLKSNDDITTLDDLEGKVIGVRLGTGASDFAHSLKGVGEVLDFDSGYVMLMELLNGKVDVIIDEHIVNNYIINAKLSENKLKIAGQPFNPKDANNPKSYAFAISKNKKDVLEAFDIAIDKLKEKGEFKKIYTDKIQQDFEQYFKNGNE